MPENCIAITGLVWIGPVITGPVVKEGGVKESGEYNRVFTINVPQTFYTIAMKNNTGLVPKRKKTISVMMYVK